MKQPDLGPKPNVMLDLNSAGACAGVFIHGLLISGVSLVQFVPADHPGNSDGEELVVLAIPRRLVRIVEKARGRND